MKAIVYEGVKNVNVRDVADPTIKKSDDIIIMSSDGTGDNFENIINDNLDLIDQLHPQEVATLLMDKVLEDNNLDDISIIVVKVVNARNDN